MASVAGSRKKDRKTTLQDFELSVTLGKDDVVACD